MILKQLLERLEYEVVQGSDKIEITTLVSYRMYAGMKISLIRRNSYDFKTVIGTFGI